MHVVIFEGSRWPTFAPLSLSRPVFTLVSGTSTLLEKQVRHLKPTRLTLWVRPELEEHCRVRIAPKQPVPTAVNVPLDDEPAVLVSGRSVLFSEYEAPCDNCVLVHATDDGDLVHSAHVHSPGLTPDDAMDRTDPWMKILDLPQLSPQGRLVGTLWDLIHWNEESITTDAVGLLDEPRAHAAGPYHMVREEEIFLGEDVSLAPGVVLDASKGPIMIADHARIGANAVIVGPCYIGIHVNVMPLSHVRPGTTIGPMCKVGGEVSNSIMLGYSNKSHEGYLGDSYLGKWVNFGAGTITSNLKNTYGEISVRRGGKEIPTGRRFLGALVGDHTKTGVLTRLGAGSYIGFCSSLAGRGTAPRFVPSYSFWTEDGMQRYDMDRAVEVTQRVYTRRDREFTETDRRVMEYVARVAPEVEG
jgi:UDP-N-acetylglucosamine diphosphorylase / glucose-1-phosphate thymidylyltransferase / UDP-N-acetylgalactosamine diphosphorylase / glucosamine-1-phosphate N-acetyltransferase / galactosamine-1-phosphate N-acetyltransferase